MSFALPNGAVRDRQEWPEAACPAGARYALPNRGQFHRLPKTVLAEEIADALAELTDLGAILAPKIGPDRPT
jgi:hypothetical protein